MTRHLTSVVLLAAWLGATLLAAAVVAPAAFAVLPTRALAGALVGRVLPPLFLAGVVVGAAAAALQWGGGARGLRLALPLIVALAGAGAQFAVGPRIARLRAEIGPSVDALAPTDPRRRAFGRLHGVSVLLLGAAGLSAAAALVAAAAALRSRA
ncbi:MAG: hypothetical protein AVDCRST_MAG40-2800 [uncultured Gemmatimonadaceae bacterium]|uniref:TMEM205-like domain-containing protein n=1 Tax=uncultured Gemmatimonadaceae bacterium TaxID=246130 RepID=A0A6J4M5L9_9BACT|nr:MAG: hypothetical protein AVDCRST_MAG40-2800 [uncultured Gemmatimonadaceae bacterium]